MRTVNLLEMGAGGYGVGRTRPERLHAAFLASFLDPAALPPGMRLIRPPAPEPATEPRGPRPLHYGHAIWLSSPDAELYRVDDWRWLLRSERAAVALVRRLMAETPDPDDGYHLLARSGPAVARLRTVPGEGCPLPGAVVTALGSWARERVTGLAAAAAEPRRPGWWPPGPS